MAGHRDSEREIEPACSLRAVSPTVEKGNKMQTLEERLGYTFRDKSLLQGAIIHSSYANEHRGAGLHSNERLEFLGDAVLGLVAGEHLYCTHPDAPEGDLTRMRAALVREESLYRDGTGSVFLKDGALYWNDLKENVCKDCVFRRAR